MLSGTSYEKEISNFTSNINELLKNHKIKLEIVKSTGSNIGRLLFNNREKFNAHECNVGNCYICANEIKDPGSQVPSKITHYEYLLDKTTQLLRLWYLSNYMSVLSSLHRRDDNKFQPKVRRAF